MASYAAFLRYQDLKHGGVMRMPNYQCEMVNLRNLRILDNVGLDNVGLVEIEAA